MALRPWIEDISVITTSPDERQPIVHLPDTATALVFCVGTTGTTQDGELVVTGPRTRGYYYRWKPVSFSLRLRIRPGTARPLLGVSIADLVDRTVTIGELWGEEGDRLVDDLRGVAAEPARVLDRVEAALLTRLQAQSRKDLSQSRLVHAAAGGLTVGGRDGSEPVRSVAGRLGVSERHLRTLFAAEVGVSPKRFARIDRVRTTLARAGQVPWAQIASEAGYYDQAHLTAEFRDMMGVPPGAYAAGRLPTGQDCRGEHPTPIR